MVAPAKGTVILIPFPFSDLTATKLRPAIVLASSGKDDWILCQVTANPYSDSNSIEISDNDFKDGSLQRISYARPGKLFTANSNIMKVKIGLLKKYTLMVIINRVVEILRHGL